MTKHRELEETVFKTLMVISLGIVLLSLAGILGIVLAKGLAYLDWAMITQTPKGGYYLGKEGGIANAITGSLYLGFGALVLAFIVSLPLAIALQQDYLGRRTAAAVRVVLDVLSAIPSIVYGAFAFIVMRWLAMRASLLGGIVTLALLIIPLMTRIMDTAMATVPHDLKEASYAMGATRSETSFLVVVRQAMPGIVTACLIAFGRAIGDAASILFTAGYTDAMPSSFFEPVASLPLAIFFQIGTPIPEVQGRAYASAVILLAIILAVSLISRHISGKLSENNLA